MASCSHADTSPDPRDYTTAEMITWAHCYDGYKRIAAGAPQLAEVLRPAREALTASGTIPDWAGLDLLRAWAFLLVRVDTHRSAGGATLGAEFAAVVDAIDAHAGASPRERSPLDRSAQPHPPCGGTLVELNEIRVGPQKIAE